MTNATTRDFLKNFSKLKKQNEVLVIMNRKNPEGVFIPFPKWQKEFAPKEKKIDLNKIKKFFIKGPKNLSQTIDNIYK